LIGYCYEIGRNFMQMMPFIKFFKKGTGTFFSDVSYLISGLVSLPPPVCVYDVFMIQ
jgi:hypothetical protein